METSKTLEEAERKSRRALWTMKALTIVVWLTFFAFLIVVLYKGMHRSNNIIDDIQIEQLAVVTLQLIEPKPRDTAVLEETFRRELPRALRLMELTRDFLDAKGKENAERTDPEK
jgi:LPS O-antigen subunit length determinant protein (WzzB/FepE family)